MGTLKKYLPHGYAEIFATKYNCSVSKVYKVANGRLNDFRMLEAMRQMAMENLEIERQIEKTNKKIGS
ncbi:hypothetical protein LJC68_07185 [Bacteroidales bacterium OttesenSCG-928-B11]|nr:hypothetical protein [Bacteroidales bacterium OttesenSCG-928-C03]MDL2312642.1 hypothetical protein [Bacteroidales bacterium OttesenSCG-928-B11]MDL2326113.1 hypothetical protein [Bacteroidales bacterium OttesenSCG-928-A14]